MDNRSDWRERTPFVSLPSPEVFNVRFERIKGNLIVAALAIAGAYVTNAIGFGGWISGAFLAIAFIVLIVSIDFYAMTTPKKAI